MRRIFLLFVLLSALCFISACKGGEGVTPTPNTSLLTGKWNLQQQMSVQYVDGVLKIDTAFKASATSIGHLQFNTDGSFNSASHFVVVNPITGGLNGGLNVVGQDSTYGTYSFANSVLKLSSPIAGISGASASYFGTTTTVPVYTPISNSAKINQLTSSSLVIFTEYVYTLTANGTSHTYKAEGDFYYSKQ